MSSPVESTSRLREAVTFGVVLLASVLLSMFFSGCAEAPEATGARVAEQTPAPLQEPVLPDVVDPSTIAPKALIADPRAAATRDLARCQRLTRPQEHVQRFPLPRAIAPSTRFWVRIFTEWGDGEYAIHDAVNPSVVYRVVKAGHGRAPAVKRAKKKIERSLRRLAKRRPRSARGLRGVDREVFKAWSGSRDPRRFTRARGQVRAQRGQADRFAAALHESGRYRAEIEATLEERGVPRELIAIAFIESMFQLGVRSHAGAMGAWQFMPATGREYLNINPVVDERRDPIIATQAAAGYLRTAHKRLRSWPLAITSYNYGMGGMAKAVRKARTRDLDKILRRYKGKRIGFAVKNYYAEFVAALHVIERAEICFPDTEPAPAWEYEVVRLPRALSTKQLVEAEALSQRVLADLNPALSSAALASKVRLPRRMTLRVPLGMGTHFNDALFIAGHGRDRERRAKRRVHVVRNGDNVTRIAQAHGVAVGAVLAANNLTWDSPIYPNMRLAIPEQGSGTTVLSEPVRD